MLRGPALMRPPPIADLATSPFANILHRDAMLALVGARTFERGEAYFREGRVSGLARQASSLSAVVRGGAEYRVRVWVKDDALAYACTCPAGADGAFCKHAVAVGLAWVESQPR